MSEDERAPHHPTTPPAEPLDDDHDDATLELSFQDVMALQHADTMRRKGTPANAPDESTSNFAVPPELLRASASLAAVNPTHDYDATGTISAEERALLLNELGGAHTLEEDTSPDDDATFTVSPDERYRLLMQTVPEGEDTLEVDRTMLHTREGVRAPAEILSAFEQRQETGPVRLDFIAEVDQDGRLRVPSALLLRHSITPGTRLIIQAKLLKETST